MVNNLSGHKKVVSLVLLSVLMLPLLLPALPLALATPAQVPSPNSFPTSGTTTITISKGSNAPHAGSEIAVWNPLANPLFSTGCPLPGVSGGIKWQLRADTDNDGDFTDSPGSAPVTYIIPNVAGASISFPFGGGITGVGFIITLAGGATVSPASPTGGYAWRDVSIIGAAADGTDNTNTPGNYKFASCGKEGASLTVNYVGSANISVFKITTTTTTTTTTTSTTTTTPTTTTTSTTTTTTEPTTTTTSTTTTTTEPTTTTTSTTTTETMKMPTTTTTSISITTTTTKPTTTTTTTTTTTKTTTTTTKTTTVNNE